jgi:hypothetical protein
MTDHEILIALDKLAAADYEGDIALAELAPLEAQLRAELPGMPPVCAAWPLWAMIAEAAPRNLGRWRG